MLNIVLRKNNRLKYDRVARSKSSITLQLKEMTISKINHKSTQSSPSVSGIARVRVIPVSPPAGVVQPTAGIPQLILVFPRPLAYGHVVVWVVRVSQVMIQESKRTNTFTNVPRLLVFATNNIMLLSYTY